jgi:iron complex outermembrane receptor protein
MHGEGERIFSTTESKVWTVEGRYDLTDRILNSLGYHFRDSDYTLTEQHAEEEDGDDHEGEDHHGEEGPTVFSNQSKEMGLKLNFDSQKASHRIVLNVAEEKISIIGEEAFINPNKSKEMTAGYYFSREWPGLFHLDFGARFDNISRSGSVAHHDDDHHDEDGDHDGDHDDDHDGDHDDDHDDAHDDDHDEDGDHDDDEKVLEQFDLDFETTSFAGTISKSFGDHLELSVGFAKVERSPSTVELFINGPHLAAQRFEVGSTALKPEDSRNAELSFAYDSGSVFWDFTVFNNQIADYIYLRDETDAEHEEDGDHDHGSLTLGNYVQTDATFKGYEAQIGTVIAFDSGQIRLKLGRDQTRATLDRGGYAPRIPAARDLFEVYGDFARFNAVISYQRIHEQNRTSESELPTRGYNMLNLSVSAPLTLGPVTLDTTIFARNVLDDIARRHTSFVKEEAPLPGRNVGIKLSLAL